MTKISVIVKNASSSPASSLIESTSHQLGYTEMDKSHNEFVELVNKLVIADNTEFTNLFQDLQHHTEMHFCEEYLLMKKSNFPALAEHHSEHQRVLGQLAYFRARVGLGHIKLARAFIREQLPFWFRTHILTMDSALAAHLTR